MDQIQTKTFNPHLRKVLKSFQTAAMSSLNGPSNYMSTWGETSKFIPTEEEELKKAVMVMKKNPPEKCVEIDPLLAPPPYPVQQMPILAQPDQGRSERSETILEGETISCFIVGGEKRLCLPQILNSVLRDFSLQQINSVCDELHIFCSRCNHEQLEILKVMGILPFTAPSCGLITKTDAERLCNSLLHSNPPKINHAHSPSEKSFLVYHECFGKCKGIFDPELYIHPYVRCIHCADCNGLFNPEKFVCHAHKALENRICHWGFDSHNWRGYLLLAKDQQNTQELQERLDEIKSRFDYSNSYKRKQVEKEDNGKCKKVRYDESWYSYPQIESTMGWSFLYNHTRWGVSAFRPWDSIYMKGSKALPPPPPLVRPESVPRVIPPPYLSHGPPVLLNPERVVTLSESERFERHYQPNVALAPASAQRSIQTSITTVTSNIAHNPIQSSSNHSERLINDIRNDSTTDTSTDSEDFSTDSASSQEMGGISKIDTPNVLGGENLEISTEHEVDAIKGCLDSSGFAKEIKEKVLHEVAKMRLKHEEKLSNAIAAKRSLQQEVEFLRVAKREKLREEAEARRMLRKEITKQRTDYERKIQKLKQELDILRNKRYSSESCKDSPVRSPNKTLSIGSDIVIIKQEKMDEVMDKQGIDDSPVT